MEDIMREEIAAFRYQMIAPAVVEGIDPRIAAAILRDLAGKNYTIPYSRKTTVGLRTLERWVSNYRKGGFEALKPLERNDANKPRSMDPLIVELACALRREAPSRSVRQIISIMELSGRVDPGTVKRSTLAEHLARAGCSRDAIVKQKQRSYRRFGAEHRNQSWQGDCQHTLALPHPTRPNAFRKVYLLAWLDDYSRLVYGQFYWEEKGPRLEDCLKRAILRYGVPEQIYVDNGAIYSSHHLARVCGKLSIRLSHSRPYRPQGRGKQERFFRYVDQSFLPEARMLIESGRLKSLTELNEYLWSWLAIAYNGKKHSVTKQTPEDRFALDPTPIRRVDPVFLREVFLWEDKRTVDKTGCVSLHGNRYEVETSLAGRQVLLRYDPYDLGSIEVWHENKRFLDAVPFVLRRHRHHAIEPPATDKLLTGLNLLELARKEMQSRQEEALAKTSFTSLVKREED